jgi:hypothetical protein
MPLEATHIRFAEDIKNRYVVNNLDEYISGSIYPDSRYITKIDRNLTHGEECRNKNFPDSDFKMGWQSHYLCDIAFNKIKKIIFSGISFTKYDTDDAFAKNYTIDDWIISTSIKILQDINDLKYLKISGYLACLDYIDNPNDEDEKIINKYNQLIKNFYKNNQSPSVNDYKQILSAFDIAPKLVDSVISKTSQFYSDDQIMKKIKLLYGEMLKSL